MTLKRIVIPVDFSASSLKAIDEAIGLAKPVRGELIVVYVLEPVYPIGMDFNGSALDVSQLASEQRLYVEKELVKVSQKLTKRGVKHRTLLLAGIPHDEITAIAKKVKADLIVMSTHGRTGFSHLLLGSVAEKVVRTASCPVLTIGPTNRGDEKAQRKAA